MAKRENSTHDQHYWRIVKKGMDRGLGYALVVRLSPDISYSTNGNL